MARKMGRMLAGLLLAAVVVSPAWALDLDEAKSRGLVGEMASGYLGAVDTRSVEVRALVEQVNRHREARYREIAARNGTSVEAVEQLAGKKAIELTQSGHYIQRPSGAWARK